MRNKRTSCIEHFVSDGATERRLAPYSISRVKRQQPVSRYVDHGRNRINPLSTSAERNMTVGSGSPLFLP
ncbi:hypothetical protein BT69DRAFT_1289458 [Atractiella rhizophila]|nr:hypothetical protein BT69DRAFT_1289458 [Atractiella rhizophila]